MGALRNALYKNPDKRCTYPYPSKASRDEYCYSYSSHVDGYLSKKELKRACEMCKFWIVQDGSS